MNLVMLMGRAGNASINSFLKKFIGIWSIIFYLHLAS